MVKYFLLTLLFVSLFNCQKGSPTSEERISPNTQEVLRLIEVGKDKSEESEVRLKAINKAYKMVKGTLGDSSSLAVLKQKSDLHYMLEQKDSSLHYDNLLIEASAKINNHHYLARAYFNLALYHKEHMKLDSSFYYHNKSKEHYLMANDSVKVGRRLLSMATIQNEISSFFESKETATEALKYLEAKKDLRYAASAYSILGSNHRKLNNVEDAKKYYGLAISTADTVSDYKFVYMSNLANVYIENKEYEKAIDLLASAKKDSIRLERLNQLERVKDNFWYATWLHSGQDVSTPLKLVLEERITKKDWFGAIASCMHLGRFYKEVNPKTARDYFLKGIEYSRKCASKQGELEHLKELINLDPRDVVHLERYARLSDSIYSNNLKVTTKFAKMKYDDEQEKIQIQKLEKETAEKRIALAEQKTQKVIYLALIGFLLISGLAYYYLLRQRHKKDKIAEVYQTENRISKRVHDELANDIYGVMAALQQGVNTKSSTLIPRLESIYDRTRTISQDTGRIKIGSGFKEDLRDMLALFQGNGTSIVIRGLEEIEWRKLEDHKCITVHRVLKELMVNMSKHARASLVGLTFTHHKKKLQITYSDNGIGCTPQQKMGNGLQNTVSRIRNVGGEFKFDSDKDKGVKIRLFIPF